eukprot:899887-Rhodomonas_salina.2
MRVSRLEPLPGCHSVRLRYIVTTESADCGSSDMHDKTCGRRDRSTTFGQCVVCVICDLQDDEGDERGVGTDSGGHRAAITAIIKSGVVRMSGTRPVTPYAKL